MDASLPNVSDVAAPALTETENDSGVATPSSSVSAQKQGLETSLAHVLEPLCAENSNTVTSKPDAWSSEEPPNTAKSAAVQNAEQQERELVQRVWSELCSMHKSLDRAVRRGEASETTNDSFERAWRSMKRLKQPSRKSTSQLMRRETRWQALRRCQHPVDATGLDTATRTKDSAELDMLLGLTSSADASTSRPEVSDRRVRAAVVSNRQDPQTFSAPASTLMKRLPKIAAERGRMHRPSTFALTQRQWERFKNEKGLSEELEHYKKSEQRYTDRLEFLVQTDFREWAHEQAQKRRNKTESASGRSELGDTDAILSSSSDEM
jgi:hypothetical protein